MLLRLLCLMSAHVDACEAGATYLGTDGEEKAESSSWILDSFLDLFNR